MTHSERSKADWSHLENIETVQILSEYQGKFETIEITRINWTYPRYSRIVSETLNQVIVEPTNLWNLRNK